MKALLRGPALTDRIEPTSMPESRVTSLFTGRSNLNILNGACAVLAITCCAAGCATSAPSSDHVKTTTTLADVDGCNLLGKVIVADTGDPAKAARDKTASLGGNVLLRKNDQVWNGNAYQCPAAAH